MKKLLLILLICLVALVCFAQEPSPILLTKQITYDHFISEDGFIHVREITRIFEGDIVLSKSYHRHVIVPTDNVDNEDDRTKLIAGVLYTPEFIAEYEEKLAAQKAELIE